MTSESQPGETEESKMETVTETKLQDAWEQRDKLYAEGDKLYAEGAKLWAEAIIETYGPREPIDWSESPACIVRGVKYEAKP